MKRIVFALGLVATIAGFAAATATVAQAAHTGPLTGPPLCVKIAVVDTGRVAKTTDARVRQCQAVFRALRPKCKEAPARLADIAVKGRQILREHGMNESVLSILSHANASIPRALGRTRCLDIFAAYVTIRTGG